MTQRDMRAYFAGAGGAHLAGALRGWLLVDGGTSHGLFTAN